jgi:hypothetical protein
LPCGNYPGEKERVWIPVKIKAAPQKGEEV